MPVIIMGANFEKYIGLHNKVDIHKISENKLNHIIDSKFMFII